MMITAQADKNANNASPVASPVPTPNAEIVALTSQIEPLRTKAEWLDTANVVLLYMAGAVAVGIAIFGFWSSRVNRNLRGLEASLGKAKDAQLGVNLKEKDAEISKTGQKAAEANERAQKIEGDNIQLRADLENATAEARVKQVIIVGSKPAFPSED